MNRDGELKDVIESLFPDSEETIANRSVQEGMERIQSRIQNLQQRMVASLPPDQSNNPEILSMINDVIERETGDLLSSLNDTFPNPNRSKLSEENKAEIRGLVDAGASLSSIDALHLAASHYKQPDLFDLLINEYGLGVEDSDHHDLKSKPLHVAACFGNCEAIEILLAKGADKKSTNSKGRNPLQEVKHSNREMQRGNA